MFPSMKSHSDIYYVNYVVLLQPRARPITILICIQLSSQNFPTALELNPR